MFNSTQDIEVRLPSPEGPKEVVVRFPSDEELIARMSAQKTIVRNLGRGKAITEPASATEKIDFDLFNKIKVSGADLDEYEAQRLMGKLLRAEVTDARREGPKFVVELDTAGGKTLHTLRMPTAKQVIEYRRAVVSIIDCRRHQEIRMNLAASQDLYDKLFESVEGYEGPVPVVHKSSVLSEVLSLLDSDEDDSEIQSFRR